MYQQSLGVTPCGAVKSTLRLPQDFGIAGVLPSYSFALILSDPARKALPILLSYPTVVGR